MYSAKDSDENSENKYYRRSPFILEQNDEGSCSTAACSLLVCFPEGMLVCPVVLYCGCCVLFHFLSICTEMMNTMNWQLILFEILLCQVNTIFKPLVCK
uniref:Uncharacterized protein n=1 Tax=Oryza brachyantha TaxID=4533 RepID=J3MZD5_ORYBR